MSDIVLSSENYINRELSWLEFDDRCLRQAMDNENPLFERMNFMGIVCSNLDEFFMVRVASLREQMNAKGNSTDPAGMSAKQQLNAINNRVRKLYDDMYSAYNDDIVPRLRRVDIRILRHSELTDAQRAYCDGFFDAALYPVLTPLAIDRSHPFPFIVNKSLNLAVLAEDDKEESCYATVQVPLNFPRLFRLSENIYTPIEEVIRMNIAKIFPGYRVIDCVPYRITRDGDLTIDEEEAEDLLAEIKKSLKQRKSGAVIRLEIDSSASQKLKKFITKSFDLEKREIYEINGPLSLNTLLKELFKLGGYDALRYVPFTANVPERLRDKDACIFDEIKKGDILLHHPYDSFEPVIRLLNQAAEDNGVIAIKQTLYRVSKQSPIINALIKAAENGKQVTALVELKARFDEENNITYGEELARKGVNVVYGVEHLKTHSKITLVIRREENTVRQYLHLGTGNYNDVTAGIYTDYGLLTADEALGSDATAFFNSITGFFRQPNLTHLIMAPHTMRSTFYELLDEQMDLAQRKMGGEVYAKMNSLSDPNMIKKIYEAAQAGVRIRLLVRGICCLDPNCSDAAGNIEVRSIVGRFLEHTRVYMFGSGSDRKIFLASADWMTRNLNRRVELMFPLLDKSIAQRVYEEAELYWSDNVKARVLGKNGKYEMLDTSRRTVRRKENTSIFDFGIEEAPVTEEIITIPAVNTQEILVERARKLMTPDEEE